MAAPPLLFPLCRASLAPRIHYRLPCDIRHRYSRYRPPYLHRPGGRCGPGYGSDAELAAGYFVDDAFSACDIGLQIDYIATPTGDVLLAKEVRHV